MSAIALDPAARAASMAEFAALHHHLHCLREETARLGLGAAAQMVGCAEFAVDDALRR